MNRPRAIVLRAPGINCDRETARACRLVGFETDLLHINHLLKAPERLLSYHLLVIPGGFSYGDDLGAGTLLAKNLVVHLEKEIRQFIAEGRLVLGICNGFQVLVRAGLLPGRIDVQSRDGSMLAASLTDNASARFECRWTTLMARPGPCIFTRGIDSSIELPVAHGEGRFALSNPAELVQLRAEGQTALLYTSSAGQASPSSATPPFENSLAYPDNPNGSLGDIAGVCNAGGNVFGLMPHPERYVQTLQHPQRRGQDGKGDGWLIFQNAYDYALHLTDKHNQALRLSEGKVSSESPMNPQPLNGSASFTYASSGVDINAADTAKALMKEAVRSTQGPEVLAGMGAFAGVFRANSLQEMRQPALVASTDGVGTKTLLAVQAGRFDTIGHDVVNHSVNDLLTQGAKPLFFMDYLAMGRLDPAQAATIVRSVAEACKETDCALLGGETAEMPDVYLPEAFDLAGTIVGAVDLAEQWENGAAIRAGDILLGLPSSGLHTNGYSLARRVFASYGFHTVFPELGEPLGDALLRPHRSYLREIQLLRREIEIKGLAHITGGGFEGNISRILPTGVQAVINTNAWEVPALFRLIERLGGIGREEMYRAFNMGVGMVLVVSCEAVAQARLLLPELLNVGYIREGDGVVLQEE